MTAALVHIGFPKCGSTSVQAFLTANRASLFRAGYAVAGTRLGEPRLAFAGAHEAGQWLPDDTLVARNGVSKLQDQDALAQSLADEIAQQRDKTWVMSCEQAGAALETGHMPSALHRWLSKRFADVRYLLVVRPQAEYMLSAYSEALRSGRTETLEAFVTNYRELDLRTATLSWRAALGHRLTVMRLPRNGEVNLLEQFIKWAGLPQGLHMPKLRNRSLGETQRKALRAINQYLPSPPRRGVARICTGVLNRLLPVILPNGPSTGFTAEQLALIQKRWPDGIDDLVTT